MISSIKIWSRSPLIPARDHGSAILPPADRPEPIPELCEEKPPVMGWLLGWEYGRKWLERREEIHRHRNMVSKFGRIPADFGWWLNQRRPLFVRQQRFRTKAAQHPRKPITAFEVSKQRRAAQNKKVEESLAKHQ
ncbi:uncharacterized protein LOC108091370 [Drosophila ficusphila]|uniref:uncharacterized protein LOC108091370 n=1 Tax=Drosophila ficusphila TaxID=30025 RepID=UPI0007E65347|nr:uncharacterized protein LOC108091370 [Drosophila ficusphila]